MKKATQHPSIWDMSPRVDFSSSNFSNEMKDYRMPTLNFQKNSPLVFRHKKWENLSSSYSIEAPGSEHNSHFVFQYLSSFSSNLGNLPPKKYKFLDHNAHRPCTKISMADFPFGGMTTSSANKLLGTNCVLSISM